MDIVAIEFDTKKYEDILDCISWLRSNPEYQFVTENKNFKLKTTAKSIFMSTEPRKVHGWHQNIPNWRDFTLERPEPHIMILRKVGNSFWQTQDMPPLTPETKRKREIYDRKQIELQMRRRQKALQASIRRQEAATNRPIRVPKNSVGLADTDSVYAPIKRRRKAVTRIPKKIKLEVEETPSIFDEAVLPLQPLEEPAKTDVK